MKNHRKRFFQQSDTTRFASKCSRQYVPLPREWPGHRREKKRARGKEKDRKERRKDRMGKEEGKIGAVDLRPRHGIVIRPSSYLHGEEAWSEFPRIGFSIFRAFLGALTMTMRRKTTPPRRSRKIIAARIIFRAPLRLIDTEDILYIRDRSVWSRIHARNSLRGAFSERKARLSAEFSLI